MNQIALPADLEQFAADAVASGRYRDTSEVVRAGLALLRDAEAELDEFVASLEGARQEAERDGYVSLDEVAARMQARIEEVDRAKR
jgi:putative addiction module CopG family antidote